ncbi:tetratricopeptide repeat protein [Steroidobacter flavus]|uniref:Tetratricopeptide repeat protein n=1 Tax=Steroidobacter flavus TaxID=1842136 RepID=A0ABV8T6R7_9GAMM
MTDASSLCPAADVIAAFAFGELDAASALPVQSHVSICETCLATVGHLATMRSSASGAETTEAHAALTAPGQEIGPYRLVRRVGEGGMGEVWEAEQHTPLRRTVALKLLKPGMDTRQILTRFSVERQMLALMQHPSIAQVFDAGATVAGRPYLVMEYVDGTRITSYCDQHTLSLRARLQLFQEVCGAVQHAHQKGVIHRDLKPSNVLVTHHAGKPLAKVIDFGLAKATARDITDASLTEFGTVLGTPAYASPEQLSVGAIDIDTRSDVYSLGALLYELLVGVIPFDADGTQPAAIIELRHAIREREPMRPSARVSRLGDRSGAIAQSRGVEPVVLRKQLRGELDWIVMKALEKERDRRYSSPHELALDIDRYLKHEPLQAGPASAAYRARKFVRRHRVGTAFAAALAGVVVAFVVVTLVQAQRIAKERDRATAEAAKANSINAFLQETLGSADPWKTGKDVSIREVLNIAAQKADAEFKDQPLIAAAVKNTIGRTFVSLGQIEPGEQLIRSALDMRRAQLGSQDPDVAASLNDLAELLHQRSEYVEADQRTREALDARRAVFGERSKEVAESLDQLAMGLLLQGEFGAAENAALEGLSVREQLFGPQSPEAADSLLTLASIANNGEGNFEKGEQLGQRAYDIYSKAFGPHDLHTALAANAIGVSHWMRGQNEQALDYYRKVLDSYERLTGPDNPETATSKENVANALGRLQRFDESIPLLESVLAVRRAKAGEDAAVTARTMGNLAAHEMQAGHLDRAQAWFDKALPGYAKAYGTDHPDYANVLSNYAALKRKQSQPGPAEELLRQALAIRVAKLGEEHLSLAKTRFELGTLLLERNEYAQAEALLTRSYEVRAKQLGATHAQTRAAADSLIQLYTAWGKPDKVAALKQPAQ